MLFSTPDVGLSLLSLVLLAPLAATAQALPNHYGAPVGVETARKVAQAAIAEGKKNGWTVAAAIVDPGGTLVYFERIDGTQNGSSEVAQEKARTAAAFKRPSKALEDAVTSGKSQFLRLPGALPIEGGLPLVIDGKIVGAIGVSGANSQQDGVCAKAGADTLGHAMPEKK
ncbi:MAG: GlcG/HbpS family heme-binding protein [Myxococcaceae bacterium]